MSEKTNVKHVVAFDWSEAVTPDVQDEGGTSDDTNDRWDGDIIMEFTSSKWNKLFNSLFKDKPMSFIIPEDTVIAVAMIALVIHQLEAAYS